METIDLEAKLTSTKGAKQYLKTLPLLGIPVAHGEAELEMYDYGNLKFSCELYGLKLPPRAQLEILIEGKRVLGLVSDDGTTATLRNLSQDNQPVPEVKVGYKIEIKYGVATLFTGTFVND